MLAGKQLIRAVCLAITMTLITGAASFAAEEPEPDVVTLQGFIGVYTDANDVIELVQLITSAAVQQESVNTYADANEVIESSQETTIEEVIYDVVLDKKGIELGKNEDVDYKEFEVTGIVTAEDEQAWIKVLSFKAIEEQEQGQE